MIQVRRIYDDVIPVDKEVLQHAQEILREQFQDLDQKTIAALPEQLRNPLKYRFRSIFFAAEGISGRLKGFALLQHDPHLGFCFLDFLSAAKLRTGSGIGSVLYERVREEALRLKAIGLFFECLPDDPTLCQNPDILKQNRARLRFYEHYGALPIVNTRYETPVTPKDDCPPYLVFDNLGQKTPVHRNRVRPIIRAILARKYGDICPQAYVDMVVNSFQDRTLQLRPPKYAKSESNYQVRPVGSVEKQIALVVTDTHAIHHVHERGYVESPVRIAAILRVIARSGLFEQKKIRHFSEKHIKAVHDGPFVEYLKKVCANVAPGQSVYPYVFPIRNGARPPKELPLRAGYYCIDTFTPLNNDAYSAAKRAVDCALTAAQKILSGYRLAYALIRPPGHHAERRAFGGFCYFNAAAIVAHYLSSYGKVAVLDVDYHHGNGTQDIFYGRADVLTVSIHGHPRFAYPYFSGFKDEPGEGAGRGYNLNLPLPEQVSGARYHEALGLALGRIRRFRPNFMVVALGLDTAKGDPTGSWTLEPRDFRTNGRMIGALTVPTLVIQEGGYRIRSLGTNAKNFFNGLWEGAVRPPARSHQPGNAKRADNLTGS